MKKVFTFLALAGLALGAVAQSGKTTEEARRELFKEFHKRDYSKQHLKSDIKQGAPTKRTLHDDLKALPEDRVWFPGEWEEVKAVTVTALYSYLVPGHENDPYWMADPLVTGNAVYYQYTYSGMQQRGHGPYTSVMDTVSDMGKVFFYLMDGIQLGGAQAWVRVEQPEDSLIVLRTLTRMGLRHNNVRFIVGPGNSFWYRDCGPIAFYHGDQDELAMLDFTYYPGRALDDSLPSRIHNQMGIPNYITLLEWEGGNCLVDGAGMVVSSDAIYENNTDGYGQLVWDGRNINSLSYQQVPRLNRNQIKQALAGLIGQRATHILPAYRYDGGTGHIDLYADAYDENGFVFSIMPNDYSTWTDYITGSRNIDSLCSYKSLFGRDYYTMATLPFPRTDNGGLFSSQSEYNDYYTRTYSNHTFVNNVILQPCFSEVVNGQPSAAWDRENIELIKKAYPGYTIYPVDVRSFDGSGGAIHCVTKQIPADNPVRILHKNLHGTLAPSLRTDLPVSAVITNRSGIAHAEAMYRINGGSWQTLNLTANGNRFSGHFPLQNVNTVVDTVEYYISATSANGKTITKPITAAQGGYYSFCFGGDSVEVDSTLIDTATLAMPMEDITFTFGTEWAHEDTAAIHQAPSAETLFGQFYPNPAADQAHLRVDLANGARYNVSIMDHSGRTVHTSTLQSAGTIVYTINTARLAAGAYIVVFDNGSSRVSRKLIVK